MQENKKENFLSQLHPATQISLVSILILLSLATSNPILEISLILSSAIVAASANQFRNWLSWWKLCAWVGLFTIVINALVSREGATLIWRGPRLAVLGRLDITLEAIAYGAGMALRLSSVILAFSLLSIFVDADRVLGMLKGSGMKSALLTAITLKLLPVAVGDAKEILDAQRSRGMVKDSGGKLEIIRSRLPTLGRLLQVALDRAVGLAEAMESRAYGAGKRTSFTESNFSSGDIVVLLSFMLMAFAIVFAITLGWLSFSFYPRISFQANGKAFTFIIGAVIPATIVWLLGVLWKRRWFRARI